MTRTLWRYRINTVARLKICNDVFCVCVCAQVCVVYLRKYVCEYVRKYVCLCENAQLPPPPPPSRRDVSAMYRTLSRARDSKVDGTIN